MSYKVSFISLNDVYIHSNNEIDKRINVSTGESVESVASLTVS